MSNELIPPHGGNDLNILLLKGEEKEEELRRSDSLKKIEISSREAGDLIMLGIGGFTPLDGFMIHDDWKSVVGEMQTSNGTFWPIPITLSISEEESFSVSIGDEVALQSPETDETMAIMKVEDKYTVDKNLESLEVYKTDDLNHPGVKMVMEQKEVNLGGSLKVLSEGIFPEKFAGVYQQPRESRQLFSEKGWRRIACLQLRNPMHRSHEYLAKIALEVSDGLYIHQLVGNVKEGDIPADVRAKCIETLVDNYFVEGSVVIGGYPLDMRYAGPREALLHALFRQNYGCTHLIVGRDHAGVGDYYGPFDSQKIFDEIPEEALKINILPIDWTFYCSGCEGMSSTKTCPHGEEERLMLSGTRLRNLLSAGEEVPEHFSRPEVLEILKEYYEGLDL
ncbi:MAG: sulfate adenylyltransferase [Candidatus Marinimicrobia bacterium]|nr:sulfate adenylyltransferase [Candidatus Neomarinimicrobiota bacterium]